MHIFDPSDLKTSQLLVDFFFEFSESCKWKNYKKYFRRLDSCQSLICFHSSDSMIRKKQKQKQKTDQIIRVSAHVHHVLYTKAEHCFENHV